MNGTTIYQRERSKRIILACILIIGMYALFLRPSKAMNNLEKETDSQRIQRINEDMQYIFQKPDGAKSISADDLYFIRTRSNELIIIVDARSEEEYKEEHISGSWSFLKFEEQATGKIPTVRIFFYSNEAVRSKDVAEKYAKLGYHTYYVVGGFNAWKKLPGFKLVTSSSSDE